MWFWSNISEKQSLFHHSEYTKCISSYDKWTKSFRRACASPKYRQRFPGLQTKNVASILTSGTHIYGPLKFAFLSIILLKTMLSVHYGWRLKRPKCRKNVYQMIALILLITKVKTASRISERLKHYGSFKLGFLRYPWLHYLKKFQCNSLIFMRILWRYNGIQTLKEYLNSEILTICN